jgi:copper chaperone CopZ
LKEQVMNKILLELDRMGCGGCVKNVRNVLGKLPGVTVENIAIGRADAAYDPKQVTVDAITAALTQAGYPARQATASS